MENETNTGILETDPTVLDSEIQVPAPAVLEPKPIRLTPEQEMRQALTTCQEAYLDEVTGNRVNGAVLNMSYDQALGRLNLLRTQGENERIYQSLIKAAEKKRGG